MSVPVGIRETSDTVWEIPTSYRKGMLVPAYKSIDQVVEATALSGISKPVVRLLPIGNIKG